VTFNCCSLFVVILIIDVKYREAHSQYHLTHLLSQITPHWTRSPKSVWSGISYGRDALPVLPSVAAENT